MKKYLTYSLSSSQIAWIIASVLALNFLLHIQIIPLDIQGKHAWRQCQTIWNIKNFAESDPNILNPRVSHFNFGDTNIYRYEFPIMQWSIGMVQRVFGQHISLARILLFLITAWGSIGFFRLLRLMKFDIFSSLAGFIFFLFGPVVFYYMINPMPDNLALAASIWYLYCIVTHQETKSTKHLILAGLALLLATLAKLPFLMLSVVSIFFFLRSLSKRNKSLVQLTQYAAIQLLIISPALVWYYKVMPGWEGNGVLTGIFGGEQDWNKNKEILMYHLEKMFPQFLLYASVWIPFVLGIFYSFKRLKENVWVWIMVGITFTYLLLQFSVIGTVHDYYLMPFLPWLYIIVTIGIERLLHAKWTIWSFVAVLCILSAPVVSYKVSIDKWYSVWYNKDLYTHRVALTNAVPNDELCFMLKDISKYVFPYQVNKKGYIYSNDNLSGKAMKRIMEKQDVKYLYSDSRTFEQKEDIAPLLDSLILEAGSIHVYKLTR